MRIDKTSIFFLIFTILLLAACASGGQSDIGVPQPTVVENVAKGTATAFIVQLTNESILTDMPAPSVTAPVFDWNGDWILYDDASSNPTVITQSDGTISGKITDSFTDDTISFSASLSENGQVATGIWVDLNDGVTGTFQWQIKTGNTNQFVGSVNGPMGSTAWCGSREGAPKPEPCAWP